MALKLNNHIDILDLSSHINLLHSFFARDKSIELLNSIDYSYKLMQSIDKQEIKASIKLQNLDNALLLLNKQAILSLEDISEFIKIIRYFIYLLSLKLEEPLGKWVGKINIPLDILGINDAYDDKYQIRQDYNEELYLVYQNIKDINAQIHLSLERIISKSNSSNYLVDNSIHLRKNQDCLLARSGYSHYLKASIIDRSKNGFLYIVPVDIRNLKDKLNALNENKEILLLEIARDFSSIFYKHILFLKYINKSFDFFDSLMARVLFAKSMELSFLMPSQDNEHQEIFIKDFHHPAIKNSKAINLNLSKNILIITGVNAGGKTVLLKSILAISLMSQYLIPMKIDGNNSKIKKFKNLIAIISDMQNINAGISTFASRMLQISKAFECENSLIGIDECELGTDSEEAACLFKAIFDSLNQKKHTLIITTHHKKLASLMVKDENCQLLAAKYDEKLEKPTYDFMSGVVGKSFAFETALRYQIPKYVIKEAREIYGKSGDSLNNLIEKTTSLEQYLIEKKEAIKQEHKDIKEIKQEIVKLKEKTNKEYNNKRNNLINTYEETITSLKNTAKKSSKKIQQKINVSYKKVQNFPILSKKEEIEIKIGDMVKYKGIQAEVKQISKKYVYIESSNLNLKVYKNELDYSFAPKRNKISINIERPNFHSLELDLHGQRVEEALINTEKFVSSAILNKIKKVSIMHGFGSGQLAFHIREYLELNFPSATLSYGLKQRGGNGVTVIEF